MFKTEKLFVQQDGGFAYVDSQRRSLSERGYLFLIQLYVILGFALTGAVSVLTLQMDLSGMNIYSLILLLVGVGFCIPLIGIFWSFRSNNWLSSTLAYMLIAAPLGALLGPVLAATELSTIVNAILSVTAVSICMFWIGLIMPPITKSYAGSIIAVLLVLIVINISYAFLPPTNVGKMFMGVDLYRVADYVAVAIFAGLISYDVNKAMQREYTVPNAVNSAIAIYLDIFNAFLYVRRIFSGGSK